MLTVLASYSVNVEELKKNKLFIATPMYGGMAHGLYIKSALDLQMTMNKYGIETKFSFLFNESLITRARNYLVDEFLRSEYTHMMFIDSDIHYSPQDVIALMALDKDVQSLQYIRDPTLEILEYAFKKGGSGWMLQFVKNQTEEICKLAVEYDGHALSSMYMKIPQTDELCKIAVKKNGLALIHVNSPTDEIRKLAIQQTGLALVHMYNGQTDELCELAVQQNGLALQYVRNQTDEICRLAVQQNKDALQYVWNKTEEICELALHQRP